MESTPIRTICPECGQNSMRVINTRAANCGRSDNLIARRRECMICGRRQNYIEMPEETFTTLLDIYYMSTRHMATKDEVVEAWIQDRGKRGRNKKGWVKKEGE